MDEPNYFNMNGQAGAPDDFSVMGRLAFPIIMQAMDRSFQVVENRFAKLSDYFDCFLLTIFGFFRIWEYL